MILSFFGFILTIGLYWGGKWCYQHKPKLYLSPLLTTPILIILILLCTNISYDSYNAGAKWLSDMLQPATIAFAIPLYKYFSTLKKYATEIIVSVLLGSIVAVVSSLFIAEGFHLNQQITESLIPRSVTTPIAIDIAKIVGGVPAITAVFVIITGILGAIMGPIMIRLLRIDNEIARGILFGTSSHAAGTAKAFEFSPITGTISSLSMIIAALITLGIAQLIEFIIPITGTN